MRNRSENRVRHGGTVPRLNARNRVPQAVGVGRMGPVRLNTSATLNFCPKPVQARPDEQFSSGVSRVSLAFSQSTSQSSAEPITETTAWSTTKLTAETTTIMTVCSPAKPTTVITVN